jgi:hypothetical protein
VRGPYPSLEMELLIFNDEATLLRFAQAIIEATTQGPLMLMADQTGRCHIFDPAEGYQLVKSCDRYDDAQLWLLEDEFEPLEGRLAGLEN